MGRPKGITKCHPDKTHFAFGLCYKCYKHAYYIKNRAIHLKKAKEHYANKHSMYKYGLTQAEHTKLLSGGKCLICDCIPKSTKYRNLVIDHDHNTGKVRGVLCRQCNVRLGWLENRKARITAYLGAIQV